MSCVTVSWRIPIIPEKIPVLSTITTTIIRARLQKMRHPLWIFVSNNTMPHGLPSGKGLPLHLWPPIYLGDKTRSCTETSTIGSSTHCVRIQESRLESPVPLLLRDLYRPRNGQNWITKYWEWLIFHPRDSLYHCRRSRTAEKPHQRETRPDHCVL